MKRRPLKVFQAHLGFYDTVVAAPSQKAALEAWGAGRDEFAKGFATATRDPAAIEQALAHPGKVLKRPFGSKGDYKPDAEPVPIPKLTSRQQKASGAAARQKKSREAAERKEAERELKTAQQEEIRQLTELKKREAALAREKAAAHRKTQQRIARAKARLAGAARR